APGPSRQMVETLCDALRNDPRTRTAYVERAEAIADQLELPRHCGAIADLGIRDTFRFEERTVLLGALRAFRGEKLDEIRATLDRQRFSVWVESGESQAQWGLVDAALQLVEGCEDAERQLASNVRSLDVLIDWYVAS